ncbi:RNase P and RNase MRP subunit [Coemansia guatemalensis]|uniref:RNase P and RNase MRP subunit n=1 Tax=Coemansia guatemalensis TaxID=2761395 RepID=A0A9W8I289_9FUNG|nr:RNase P and RNase MRP subunit [Coemansia guatemalensis]
MASAAREATTVRGASDRRRQVFKHALEKPYTTNWPSASQAVQGEIVDLLCTALQPLGKYFAETRHAAKYERRRRRLALRRARKNKAKVDPKELDKQQQQRTVKSSTIGHELLDHVVLGINSTTRALEKQARGVKSCGAKDLALVVVCKGDIEPQLVAHFPGLAHAARIAASTGNQQVPGKGTQQAGALRLVGVGSGSERRLAEAVGQRRVSVIGIRAGLPALDAIVQKARAGVATPSVPWIGSKIQLGAQHHAAMAESAVSLHPMTVRELHTSAPILDKKRKPAIADVAGNANKKQGRTQKNTAQ